ncbi:M23 family metallopeptidase [Streptomyces sp. KK5PA1]|uniref:M23 family metallopeptidase n=2 Tax=Actinacidiphila acididurans TaxID=2784346 RepID=A0ABS2U339_9ACTN|nr:M23 family metallopeptidase [Actinacidiphila acididurans]
MKNRTARTAKSLTRRRAAVVTGGVVAALALGSTAAFAASGGQHHGFSAASTGAVAQAVHQTADQQPDHGAGAVKAAPAVLKTTTAKTTTTVTARPVAAMKTADQAKQNAAWVTPTTGYVLGAHFNQAGSHWMHKHSGQDFVVPTGTHVRAAHEGVVVTAGWGGAYGNNIVIEHGSHLYTQYGHLSHIGVYVGEHVNTGQEIGLSGSTGNSTGPHLHFEVRTTPYYGSGVEPIHFLKQHGVNP